MVIPMRKLLLSVVSVLAAVPLYAAEPAPAVDPATLASIRDAAMRSEWAYTNLAALTDRIGPRLSGSPQLEAAVQQVAATMRSLGATVQLQPAKVPHWVRGEERGALVDYIGRPAGITQKLHLVALGNSGATPATGLTARVVVVQDFEELNKRAAEVRGAIVLFHTRFDQRLADNGEASTAYGQSVRYRNGGPSAAAALGAAAALVRSVGGADYRLPHTGNSSFKPGQTPIPAAALSAEDADLVQRLAAQGPVSMNLLLTPQTLPDADSFNVIADWPGREKADEVVIVSGHLDSWDLGTGAVDDGAGVYAAAGVIEVLRQLNLHPRRTIRFVAWTNEENGGRGGKAYAAALGGKADKQIGAIESDEGGGRSLGISAAVKPESLAALRPVIEALRPIGATALKHNEGDSGADIEPLQRMGVPGFSPLVDARSYFSYHHTAADTLDKVQPQDLQSQVATMAVLAYYLAELAEPLPRYAIAP